VGILIAGLALVALSLWSRNQRAQSGGTRPEGQAARPLLRPSVADEAERWLRDQRSR